MVPILQSGVIIPLQKRMQDDDTIKTAPIKPQMWVCIYVYFLMWVSLLHLYMCAFGSTECAGLYSCTLNVLRFGGVPPRDSFICLLHQSQVSGPWAHSQLALCKLSSQLLEGLVQFLLTYSSFGSSGSTHLRQISKRVHSIRRVTDRTFGSLSCKLSMSLDKKVKND